MQAAVACGAKSLQAAEVVCRRALSVRLAATEGGAESLPSASARCLLAQVLCDLGRCAGPSTIHRPRPKCRAKGNGVVSAWTSCGKLHGMLCS